MLRVLLLQIRVHFRQPVKRDGRRLIDDMVAEQCGVIAVVSDDGIEVPLPRLGAADRMTHPPVADDRLEANLLAEVEHLLVAIDGQPVVGRKGDGEVRLLHLLVPLERGERCWRPGPVAERECFVTIRRHAFIIRSGTGGRQERKRCHHNGRTDDTPPPRLFRRDLNQFEVAEPERTVMVTFIRNDGIVGA